MVEAIHGLVVGNWTKTVFCSAAAALSLLAANDASAQGYYRHHNHYHVAPSVAAPHAHDAAGHLIDAQGHHIDRSGRHTGAVGVYENGAYSQPIYGYGTQPSYGLQPGYGGQPGYGTGYPNTGVVPNMGGIPANSIPPNVVPGTMVSYGKILIVNPADSGGDVNYVLNGSSYSIRPGQTQSLDNDRLWTIDFASGGPRGPVRYSLSPGQFKFVVKETGWELVRSTTQVASPTLMPQSQIPPAPLPALDGGASGIPGPFNPPK